MAEQSIVMSAKKTPHYNMSCKLAIKFQTTNQQSTVTNVKKEL